jgi:RHS repeat-associated protein
MGSQRITSKLSNSGIFTSRNPLTDTTALNKSYTAKLASFTGKIKERFDSLGVNYNGTPQTGGLVSSNPVSTASSYFYHSDHLGSSSLITDGTGALVQHIEYVPFGETFIDERNGSWSTPYLFNGKEKDEETGLHYYGARYYDSRLGVWLSVDPLAEKYPNWSSYVYTFNCPVNYTDPDGKKPMKGRWVHLSETKHYNNYPALAYSQQFIPEDKYINSQFFFVRLNSGLNLSISPDRKASINVPGHKEWYPIDINKLSRGGCLSCEISALAMAISFEIADDVVKYGIPALTMLGGAIAIATLAQSGGGSVSGFKAFRMLLTALSGSWAVVGGSVKLMLNIQGNTDLANIIPTDFLNATIGIICETTINDKKTLQIIRGTLSMINGVATFSAPDTQLEAISNVSNIYGIIDGAGNLINIKNE